MITQTTTTAKTMITTNIFENLFHKVERAKQQWESTVDALPELICTVDAEERIIRANRTLERWELGDVTQVAGCDLHAVLHPGCDDPGCYLAQILADLAPEPAGEESRQIETYDPHLTRHVLVKVCPISGNQVRPGTIVANGPGHQGSVDPAQPAWAVIFHDISEHKRLVRSLQRHADRLKTINGISRSVLSVDSPQDLVDSALAQLQSFLPVQQAVVLLLDGGRTYLETLGVVGQSEALQVGTKIPLSEVRPIARRPLNRPYYVADLAQVTSRSEIEARCYEQGSTAYANLPLRINESWLGTLVVGTRHAQGFSRDDLGVLEEVADLLTVALNQSLLNAQLQETNDELQQTLRAKQESMQDLSHELRSPLGLIHGFVNLLRDETLGPLTPKQHEALSVVEDRGDYLLTLVERLLLLQTVGEQKADLAMTDVTRFLQELVSPWQLPARNRGVGLVMNLAEPLPKIPVDTSLLPQVISNLLDNALKFTPSGGTITVTARATEEEMEISVADDGAGIPPERIEAVFERYNKGKGSRGAGIGLALCREVMRAHGGSINVVSHGEGQGSKFIVRLPRRQRTAR